MDAKKPSTRSRTRSSAARSKAGSSPRRAATRLGATELLLRIDRAPPPTLYLEGPEESIKAALLAELRQAWAHGCPEAPAARVFRAAESGVDEILAAFHGASLFTPRGLSIVLDIEDLGRSERKVLALAEGLSRPSGGSVLVLVERAAETPRRALEPLRVACEVITTAVPPTRRDLFEWAERRRAREKVDAERAVIERLLDACEGDPAVFFNELEKLFTWVGPGGRITEADVADSLRPAAGADLADYLGAVALGEPALAAERLGRVLAAGASEGTLLFALSNLVGGALGGWTRHREASAALRRRAAPRDLARMLDALYRAEAAWKRGRADSVAVLEQATRVAASRTPLREGAARPSPR